MVDFLDYLPKTVISKKMYVVLKITR